jgi:hypothetical protein
MSTWRNFLAAIPSPAQILVSLSPLSHLPPRVISRVSPYWTLKAV